MSGYTKLFASILDSSVWGEDNITRIVWITILAMANRDGVVESSMGGIAARARGITNDECKKAMAKLASPDPDSRTKDYEGRRIEECEGGWKILNHGKYREKMSLENRREYQRLKMQEYRQKLKQMDKGKSLRQVITERVDAEEFADRNGKNK